MFDWLVMYSGYAGLCFCVVVKAKLSPSLRGNSDRGMHEREGQVRKSQRWSLGRCAETSFIAIACLLSGGQMPLQESDRSTTEMACKNVK